MNRYFWLLIAASAASASPLYSDCARSVQTGVLPASAGVKVTSSIAGEEGVCYKIAGDVNGVPVAGAIFDETHPAVIAHHAAVRRPFLPPPPPPAPEPAATAPPPAKAARFENVAGTDFHTGERFDLARLHCKAVLVHFWNSAADKSAQEDAEYLAYLKAQYGSQGLEVIGVTAERRHDRVRSFNDNAEAVWPLLRDQGQLATRHGVSAPSEVFLLDGRRNVLASGLRPANLEELVGRQLKSH